MSALSMKGSRIRVCVRKRPLNKKELSKGEVDVASCVNGNTVLIREPKYVKLLYFLVLVRALCFNVSHFKY